MHFGRIEEKYRPSACQASPERRNDREDARVRRAQQATAEGRPKRETPDL